MRLAGHWIRNLPLWAIWTSQGNIYKYKEHFIKNRKTATADATPTSSEVNWSGSTLSAKAEYILVQQDKG